MKTNLLKTNLLKTNLLKTNLQKKHQLYVFSILAIAALIAGAFGANFAFAKGVGSVKGAAKFATSARSASTKASFMHTVNVHDVLAMPHTAAGHNGSMPLLGNISPAKKAAAVSAKNAPRIKGLAPLTSAATVTPFTPTAKARFVGLDDSASTCPYFGGCQPPDMALGASPQWVFQGVNTSYAVYDTAGNIQPGWPLNAQAFFGVPNPPNNCDPAGPFLSDPRAFYDPNGGRFWTTMLQVEGAVGIAPNCPEQTTYWVAVSQTRDPNGLWNVYAFNMSLGTTNVADYTEFGFDAHAVYFTANMFTRDGSAYAYQEIFGANKATMEAGGSVTAYGFFGLAIGNVLVDTVQPTLGEFPTYAGPRDGLFINSFNINGDPNGNNCFSTACSGIVVWSMDHPGTRFATLTGLIVPTASYLSPPNADQPGCTQCIETIDSRITATPVFNNGAISFALGTALQNSTQVVPGLFWGQVVPQIINGQLVGGAIYQSGYFGFEGDQDASFGALMPDLNGNLIMVYDTMSSTLNPSIADAGRRATYPLGSFHDAGNLFKKGLSSTSDSRWGDYEATSYDGFSSDHIWFASQFSGKNTDWHTSIGETQFVFK